MVADLVAFGGVVSLGALAIIMQIRVSLSAAKSTTRSTAMRVLGALVPPVGVYFSFRDNRRVEGVAWCVAVVAYLVLRAAVG